MSSTLEEIKKKLQPAKQVQDATALFKLPTTEKAKIKRLKELFARLKRVNNTGRV
ncbi:hypothetical protein [Polynucleobacter sp. JS-JIR-5-A7]|uniref:hypothetical protein n=1 Tax=Polynucleobacter sp. JS-JIR-5-A7 TaxID=1758395 RepID=UPI001BFE2B80|nr:hypothetical protein [Polynucleobacter sp. JS-JIR-5-A7]QWE06607.1 hypothetical protein AOC29_11040 [Polynucleobacter sp. JS-JIR-5-A7]